MTKPYCQWLHATSNNLLQEQWNKKISWLFSSRVASDYQLTVPSQQGFKSGLIAHSQSWASTLTNSTRLAGWLDCHNPPLLNGTRHLWLVKHHSHQARNMITSWLWVNYQRTGLNPGLQRWAPPPPVWKPNRNSLSDMALLGLNWFLLGII